MEVRRGSQPEIAWIFAAPAASEEKVLISREAVRRIAEQEALRVSQEESPRNLEAGLWPVWKGEVPGLPEEQVRRISPRKEVVQISQEDRPWISVTRVPQILQ